MLTRLRQIYRTIVHTGRQLEIMRLALARLEVRMQALVPPRSLTDAEFQVFSQWGEDGILNYLSSRVPISNKFFVEFGVEDYREANTRLLLTNSGWSGLILDAQVECIRAIREDALYWQYPLTASNMTITRENINDILRDHRCSGDIGLLSIDIDGNDYWVWEAIAAIEPRIVVCEYNSIFGSVDPVTVPYARAFRRLDAHYSGLYFGAALPALQHLARRKGYALVGTNLAGNNAFFVRRELLGELPEQSCAAAFRRARFREARSSNGTLSYLSLDEGRLLIGDLSVVDVSTGAVRRVRDLQFGPQD